MRQAVLQAPGVVGWQPVAEPVLTSSAAALVRPIVVGRCDLDVAYLRGLVPLAIGSPIGHEIIGEIVAVGGDVSAVVVGQLVFVSAQISCGTCVPCRAGRTGRCTSVPFAASYGMGREGDYGCGLADLVVVPYAEAMLTPVPVGTDPVAVIGLADTAADAWRTVAPHLVTHPSGRVLVTGGLPAVIGLHAVGLAVALGATSVDYHDPDPTRGEIAAAYGGRVIESPTEATPGGYDIVVVANPPPRRVRAGGPNRGCRWGHHQHYPHPRWIADLRHHRPVPPGHYLGDRTAGLPAHPRRRRHSLGDRRVSAQHRPDHDGRVGRSATSLVQRSSACRCRTDMIHHADGVVALPRE